MKKTALTIGLLFFLLIIPLFAAAQTEVTYPAIPGVLSPQEIIETAETEADILPLFIAYLLRLLLVVSVAVVVLTIIYGGFLHFLSEDDIEKKKAAKSWILSALHGALIIFFSYSILHAISPRLAVFQLTDLTERERGTQVDLEWRLRDTYFQVPLGLLVENAALNVNARDKIYDVLDAVDDAENVANAIVDGGEQLLEIIEECPEGMSCDCDEPYFYPSPIPFFPRFPHMRPSNTLIIPEDIDRRSVMPSDAPHGLHIVLMEKAIEKIKTEIEITGENEFTRELKIVVEKLEALLDANPTTESLRDIREELDNLLQKHKIRVKNLNKETKNALEGLLSALPLSRTGFNDSTYYAQFENPWGPMPFGRTSTFANAGCYVVSVAMVIDTLLDQKVTPIDVRNYSLPYIVNGTTYGVVQNAANQYPELEAEKLPTIEAILGALDQGHMVIMGGTGPPHNISRSGGGHAYVFTGIDRDKGVVYRSDPGQPYWQTLPIHEFKRNNPTMADTIYRRSGAEQEDDFLYATLSNLKNFLLPIAEERINFLFSLFAEIFKTEEVQASCCPPCPEISPAVRMKIGEIRAYMGLFRYHLLKLIDTKAPFEENLFQLYKTSMIKTLGAKNLVTYTTLLLNRRHHEREEIDITTYEESKEIVSYYWNLWYYWDWRKWIEDTIYKVKIEGEIVEENDPVSFYLETPRHEKIIRDAERLARRENWETRRSIPPYVWWYFNRFTELPPILPFNARQDKREIPPFIWWAIVEKPMSIGPDEGRYPPCPCPEHPPCPTWPLTSGLIDKESPLYALRQSAEKMIEDLSQGMVADYVTATENIPQDISPEEFEEMFDSPAEFLTCGMEIPVGEPIDIIWNYYTELLDTIDDYLVAGVCFYELQEIMNRLAEGCSCPCSSCSGCDEDPPYCGNCVLTCDKEEIYRAYEDVLAQREVLAEIRDKIAYLVTGYFNIETENVCHPLNQDIRSEGEKAVCAGGGSVTITKHELITRKLNYSRAELDACVTRPEHFEDTLEGKRAGKIPLFGPIVEEEDLPRYTKTKRDGAVVNTHDLNWFCCSYTSLEE